MTDVLVMDLDGTLITSDFSEGRMSPNIRVFDLPEQFGVPDRIVVRPYADEYLSACRDLFSCVFLASFSPTQRVVNALEATGLTKYFDGVAGYEMIREATGDLFDGGEANISIDINGNFGLVDDFPWYSPIVLSKMSMFGVDVRPFVARMLTEEPFGEFAPVQSRHIQAPVFRADPEDNFLEVLLQSFRDNEISEAKTTA